MYWINDFLTNLSFERVTFEEKMNYPSTFQENHYQFWNFFRY